MPRPCIHSTMQVTKAIGTVRQVGLAFRIRAGRRECKLAEHNSTAGPERQGKRCLALGGVSCARVFAGW